MSRYWAISIALIIVILLCTESVSLENSDVFPFIYNSSTLPVSLTNSEMDASETPSPENCENNINKNENIFISQSPTPPVPSLPSEEQTGHDEIVVDKPQETPEALNNTPPSSNKITDLPYWYNNKEPGIRVPILMYHNLLEGKALGDGLNVSETVFEDQISTLKNYGYNTITFKDLYNHYMNGMSLPQNPILITFDDGYKSNYTIGYPILKKYDMKACIFIITSAIRSANYMSSSEIKDASDSSVIDIQSHSISHSYYLSSMAKESLIEELSGSKKQLEEITGKEVNIFCYPYGRYSQPLIDELIAQGYVFSVTTRHGCASKKHNPFLLPRIRVSGTQSGKDLKKLIDRITGRPTSLIDPEEDKIDEPIVSTNPEEATLKESMVPSNPGDTASEESINPSNSDDATSNHTEAPAHSDDTVPEINENEPTPPDASESITPTDNKQAF